MREILVYTGRSAPTSGGVEYAARLCARLEAALSALYIHPSPIELMPPFGVPALLGEMIEAAQASEAAAIGAGGTFASAMRALGVAHASWQVAEGHPPSILANVRDWTDLLVLEGGAGTAWSAPHELGELVLHARMPVIVVPPRVTTPRLDRIAIGWNASPEAMRAIHAALPLLQRAEQVVLVAGASRTATNTSVYAIVRHAPAPRYRTHSVRTARPKAEARPRATPTAEMAMADSGISAIA